MAKRPEAEKEPSHERWLLTYADLITLLMIFFVVMYALSKVDAAKFKALSGALAVVFGGGRILVGGDAGGGSATVIPEPSSTDLQGLAVEANAYLQDQNMTGSAEVARREGTLTITIGETSLFGAGSADLKGEARDKLLRLSDLLTTGPYRVRVEGHTDNVPVRSERFRSNWQLSAARAANIVDLFVREQRVPTDRISAVGLGDSRPLSDNSTEAGRARNRRVSIVLEPMAGER